MEKGMHYFSVSMDGGLEGFLEGERGLRQGNPFSPYFFVITMNVFYRMLDSGAPR